MSCGSGSPPPTSCTTHRVCWGSLVRCSRQATTRLGTTGSSCAGPGARRVRVAPKRALHVAAGASDVPRIVYVSTVSVFGDTHGRVVDETYRRPDRDFLSSYDETKFLAHQIAEDRAATVVVVQPGAIYGPGDHSELARQIEQARAGRYRMRMFPGLGVTMCYVDDVAEGVVLAAERGAVGESYVLGRDVVRLGDVLDRVADLSTPPVTTDANERHPLTPRRTHLGCRMVADGFSGSPAEGSRGTISLQISGGPQGSRTPDLRRKRPSS